MFTHTVSRVCDSERTVTDIRRVKFCVIIIIIILLGVAPYGHKLSLLFINVCVQNALKLAYVHLSVQKIFWGYTPDPRFKGRGGKAKGRVGLEGIEGREWEGKMKGREGGRGKGEGG
jgi:hypothetical protein